jgi:hypothetical protein
MNSARGGSGDADYAWRTGPNLSTGVWVEGRYTIGTSWGTSEAPLFSQGLELPIFFYGGFYALYQRSSCCFPLGGKRLCGLNRQWSWVLAPASEPAGAHTQSRRFRSMRAQPEPPLSEGYSALSLLDCVSCIGATSRGKPVMGTVASNQRETGHRLIVVKCRRTAST